MRQINVETEHFHALKKIVCSWNIYKNDSGGTTPWASATFNHQLDPWDFILSYTLYTLITKLRYKNDFPGSIVITKFTN